jgi:hypothetical protein
VQPVQLVIELGEGRPQGVHGGGVLGQRTDMSGPVSFAFEPALLFALFITVVTLLPLGFVRLQHLPDANEQHYDKQRLEAEFLGEGTNRADLRRVQGSLGVTGVDFSVRVEVDE